MSKHHKVELDKETAGLHLAMALRYLDKDKFAAATFATLAADEVKEGSKWGKDVVAVWTLAAHGTTKQEQRGIFHSAIRHKLLDPHIQDAAEGKHLPSAEDIAAIRERLVKRGHGKLLGLEASA